MRRTFTSILIVCFVGIAVFGFFAMNHNSDPAHTGCIATTAQGADCPKGESIFSFLSFHFGAFRNFSTVAYAGNSAVLLILFSFFLAFQFARSRRYQFLRLPRAYSHAAHLFGESDLLVRYKLTRWLSLHENSPARL